MEEETICTECGQPLTSINGWFDCATCENTVINRLRNEAQNGSQAEEDAPT